MRIEDRVQTNLRTDSDEAIFRQAIVNAQSQPGYRMASNNEVWPPVEDITIVDVPQDAKDTKGATGQSLAFKTGNNGEITVVRQEDNPGLYDYIERVSKLSENERVYLSIKDKDVPVMRGSDDIKLGDVASFAEMLSDGKPYIITAFMKDGSQKDIIRELTPELFDKAAARYTSQAEGYTLVTDETGLSAADLDGAKIGTPDEDDGLIELELANGDKRQISTDTTPELYTSAASKYDQFTEGDRSKAVDEARKKANLPTASELDIGALKTSEKNEKGEALTVNDLAWKNVIAKWKEGIEKGEIGADDDRAKLYRLLQAGSIASDGTQMVTLDIATGYNTEKANGKDFYGVIDANKVNEAIPALLKSEAVSKDIVAERKTALGKVEGGDAIVKKLEDMAFSADYMKYLKTLDKGVAEDDIAATYEALLMVDPAKADNFALNAEMDSMTMELNDLIGDTSKITDENLTLATQDIGKMLLTIIKKGGLDIGRRLAESEKFLQEMIGNKKTAKDFGKAMQELGAIYSANGTVTDKDIEKLLGNGKYTSLAEMPGGSALKTFQVLTKEGVIGSLGGTVSLVSGVYQLASKGGKIGDTTEERLSVAKDFVSFIGAGKHFADLANDIIGKHNQGVKAYNAKIDADNPNLSEAERAALKKDPAKPLIGLDKTFDELFGKPSGTTGGGKTMTEELAAAVDENLTKAADGTTRPDFYNKLLENAGVKDGEALKKGLEDGYQKRPGVDAPGWHKGASAALLVLSAGADTFAGVADAVIGGLTIKKGIDGKDNVSIAKGALQLASGTFATAGGLASFAGLSKGLSFIKAIAAPSFVISAVLSLMTLIPDIISDIKNTEKLTGYQKDLLNLFGQLEKDGVLSADGLKKFQFLNIYMEQYGQRDAPGDVSILDYRKDEYEFWAREGHLPEPGWDDVEHKDYDGDGPNLTTQMEGIG